MKEQIQDLLTMQGTLIRQVEEFNVEHGNGQPSAPPFPMVSKSV